jgi:hypothetical protein
MSYHVRQYMYKKEVMQYEQPERGSIKYVSGVKTNSFAWQYTP